MLSVSTSAWRRKFLCTLVLDHSWHYDNICLLHSAMHSACPVQMPSSVLPYPCLWVFSIQPTPSRPFCIKMAAQPIVSAAIPLFAALLSHN